jgi:hypothetical protein
VIHLDTELVIRKGQAAWTTIKESAEETRLRWLEIGNALLIGRHENPSNQDFGKWCEARGFDMDPSLRSDAMWYAENVASCDDHKTETHPHVIRKAHRKAQAALKRAEAARKAAEDAEAAGMPSLDEDAGPAKVETHAIPVDVAVKVNKLRHRAAAGDEGGRP